MKKMIVRVLQASLCCTILGVVAFGTQAVAAGPFGGFGCGPRNCLDVWNPVICSNGVIYSNSCYAARACATGCGPANY
jgi:hypothetical protein